MQYHLVRDPWEVTEVALDPSAWQGDQQDNFAGSWPQFIITKSSVHVHSGTTAEPYPSRIIKANNNSFRITELPGPSITGDAAFEEVLEAHQDGNSSTAIPLKYNHRYPVGVENEGNSISSFEAFFDCLLNETLFIVRQGLKADRPRSVPIYWRELLRDLKSNYDDDPAKHALIVDLAESISQPIDDITSRPKRILKRIRDQQRIQNVQEIDTHCLVDLARRPGYTLPEKAGPKQRILAIKRQESIDVLENRVTLHCCKLLEKASLRYLVTHREIEKSRRKRLVDSLYRGIKRLPLKASFRGVGRLHNPCRHPNYTLMQNLHYAKVWKAYTQLVRNEELRDAIWRWSRRLWSDYLGVYLADTMLTWCEVTPPPIFMEAGDKIVQAEFRHRFGRWLLRDVMPGPFILGKDDASIGTLYLLDGNSCEALGSEMERLSVLNADYIFVWLSQQRRRLLPVYAYLAPPDLERRDLAHSLNQIAENVLSSVKKFNSKFDDLECAGALVLHGHWSNNTLLEGYQSIHQGLCCWQSAPSPDIFSWSTLDRYRFMPIASLVGM